MSASSAFSNTIGPDLPPNHATCSGQPDTEVHGPARNNTQDALLDGQFSVYAR